MIKYVKKSGNRYFYYWDVLKVAVLPSGMRPTPETYEFGVSLYLEGKMIGNFPMEHTNKNKVPDKKLDKFILLYLPNIIIDIFEKDN